MLGAAGQLYFLRTLSIQHRMTLIACLSLSFDLRVTIITLEIIIFLDFVHRTAFSQKHNVSESGCLRLQAK
jgi:hypothetical protein